MLTAVAPLAGYGCATHTAGIDPALFQAHIDYLAADDLEGRGLGSRGIDLAADYIGKQFGALGLKPLGDNGTFFQTFDMTLQRERTGQSRLAFGASSSLPGPEFVPLAFSSDAAFDGDVVFCGYGIVAPDRQWDDFADIDVDGKVALILRGEPPSWADDNGFPSRNAMLRNKVYNAKDRGAVAVLLVNQAPDDGEADKLITFDANRADAYGLPAMHVARATVEPLLAAGGLASLDGLQAVLDAGHTSSGPVAGVTAAGQAVFKTRSAAVRNVVGMIPGQGPHADEYVVIGAHYDHLGIRTPMMRRFKQGKLVADAGEPQIHNGADDNASGTSGLMEIARRFSEGPPPERGIVFIAFTAEETGLHGSKHFVDNPPVPLDDIVAMLNMDMIGRLEPGKNTVQVFGISTAPQLERITKRAARRVGLKIAPSPDAGGRSDHAAFVRNEIPAMHFFTGNHSDYHKPSDDSDKINAPDGARVATLVYHVARGIARADGGLAFRAPKRDKQAQPEGTPTYRVVMGLTPGYGDDGKPGMPVDAVNPDGPADLAGMKGGDRVVAIGGKPVANIYDYMAATRRNNPGDTVEVVVLRDGKEHRLNVTLSGAR
ncbi:MAG: M20/M25/M40 family metallo-hydrolase [Phycisphaerae bacterium]